MRRFFSFRRSLVIISILFLTLLSFVFRNQSAFSETRNPVSAMAAFITASMTGTLINDDGDNKLDPTNGNPSTTEKVQYTATITNSGADPASNVVFTDTIDSHTTLVANSLNASPIAFDQSVSTNEDAPLNINLTGTDPNGNSISFVNVTNTTNGILSGTAPNLTYTPNANFNGTDSFTFKVNDGTVSSNEVGTISITVNSVNDAPSFTKGLNQTVNEDASAQTVNPWAAGISPGPANESGQTVSFEITGNTNTSLFSAGPVVSSTGVLTYTPAANQNGTAIITLKIKDNGGTANGGIDESATQSFTITINPVNDAPVAQNKNFTAQANMKIIGLTGLLSGVTDADSGISGCSPSFTVTNVSATSPSGGAVTNLNASTGTFDFDPPPGVTGNVTFTYTVTDDGCPAPAATSAAATVTINVAGPVIWFVNPNAAANGDGRLSNPFKFLSNNAGANNDADDVDAINQRIFVYNGTATGGIALNSGEWLIGEGVTGTSFDTVMGITPPAGTIARPAINGTKPVIQSAVTLETNTTVRGISLSTGSGTAMNDPAGAITGVTIGEVNLTTTTGTALLLSSAAGTFNFTGLVTMGGTGANLTNNTGGTFTFTNVSISSGANTGFTATGGGTINICDETPCNPAVTGGIANAITTTTGTALNITNTTIGANNLEFRSISAGTAASGPANAVILNNTGSSGGLKIKGTSTAGSGGTIQHGTIGISLTSTANISLDRMQLNDFGDFAVRGTSVSGFSLSNSTINGVNGNDDVANEGSISFDELTGSASLTNVNISGGWEDNLRLSNTSGTLNRMTLTGCNIGANSAGFGNTALNIMASGTAAVNLTVTGCTFTGSRSHFVQFLLNGTSTPSGDFVFTNNTITQSMAAIAGAGDVFVSSGGNGNPTLTYNIQGNMMQGAVGNAINVSKGSGTGNFNGTIDMNTIGATGIANSGSSQGNGIAIIHLGGGTHTTSITNNTIRRYNNDGILIQSGDNTSGGNGTVNATITGNTVKEPDSFALHGMEFNIGTTTNDSHFLCASIGGAGTLRNDANTGGNAGNGGFDFRIRQRQSTTIRLPGYGGANNDAAAVTSYIQGINIPTPTVSPSNTVGSGGGGFVGGAACPQPSAAFAAIIPAGKSGNDLHFSKVSYQTSSELLESIQPLFEHSVESGITKHDEIITEPQPVDSYVTSRQLAEVVLQNQFIQSSEVTAEESAKANAELIDEITSNVDSYLTTAFINNALSSAANISDKLASIISPAVHAENNPNESNNELSAMFSGETVRVDGTTGGSGSGFILPAGKSVTITYQVTLNNPPNLSGVPPTSPQITNQGMITATGGISVLTDDPAAGGTSDPTTTPVDLFDTMTTIQSSNANSSQGEAVTFTATVVSNPAGNPTAVTGTVQFFDGASPITCNEGNISTQTLNVSGIATCTTSAITPAGSPHTIKAQYNGDGNFDPSSGTVSQTVQACISNPIVTTTNDTGAGSLRNAMTNVCTAPNNNITFNLGAGSHTITLTSGELSAARNVSITNTLSAGNGAVTVSGNNTSRIFNINSGITANISNINMMGGLAASSGAVQNTGTLTLSGVSIFNNKSTGDGGAIRNDGVLTIVNSTLSGNEATVNGGAILNGAGKTTSLFNVTITGNNAGGSGDGVNNGGALKVKNSIIAGNDTGSDNIFNGGSGTLTDLGNNITSGDARLAALADNGGATQTHALLIDSPALDAGDNCVVDASCGAENPPISLTTDQRGTGFVRKRDAADANTTQTVDIGAFEADPTVENITNKTTPEDTPLSFTFNVGDDTTAFDSITAVSGAGDQTLVPNANITVTAAVTGQRTLSITPTANQNGTATITVTVTKTISGKTLSMSDTFTLTVSEVNDAPVANPDTLTNVAEDSGMRTISIASLLANDSAGAPNENTQTLTLSLVNGSAAGGTATSDATNVYFTPAADYNGIAGFQYTVTDNGTTNSAADPKTSGPAAVSFTIWEVNDAPVAVNDTLTSVNEDSGQRIIPFSDLTTNDSKGAANESAQTLIVKTVGGAVGGTVTLDTPNSRVLFTPDANFNGTASFTYTIEDNGTTNGVADPKTSAAAATVSFSVTAVNDAPTLDAITSPQTILEDANTVTVNLTGITAGPADESSQTLTVTATSDNPGLIPNPAITYTSPGTTGTLTYKPVANQNGTATITVTVTDNGATGGGNVNTFQRTFTVNVTAVNDAPSFTKGLDQTVNEDAGAQTINGWATNISAGPADEAGQTLTFNVTTNNNALFSAAPVINPANGNLTYTPAANAFGTATVTVTLSDNGGTANNGFNTSAPQTFVITVNAVNDAPTLDAITNPAAIAEDSAQQTVNLAGITAGPANENTQTLTITATSDNPGLIPNPTVNYTSPSATGTLNYTPAANANGTAVITVTVKDNGGTDNNGSDTFTRTFTVTVWEVNDAPTAVNDTLTDVAEDSGQRIIPFADLTTNDSKGPANESGQALIVKTAGGAVGGTVVLDSANNRVLFTPAANYNGPASFTYTVEDNGTTNGVSDPKTSSAAATVSFNVTAVNDAPTLDAITTPQTILEDADTVTVNLTGIMAGSADESSQALTVTAASDNPGLIPNPTVTYTSPSATGTLTFKPVANQSGTAIITVTVTDNGATGGANVNTFQRTFTVNVTAVNDAPTLDPIPDPATILFNSGQQTVNLTGITAGGGETQTLTVTAVSNNPGLIPNPTVNYTSPNTTGSLNYTPVPNQSGTAVITVTVMDNGGTANNGVNTFQRTFTVRVVALADLSVTETDSPDPVIPGNNIAYTINVTNGGPADAAAAALTSVIPANTTYQMIYAPAGWTCTTPAVNGTGTVSCTNPLLANGANAGFVLVVNVNVGTSTGTVITNTTSVTSTNPDPNTANNTASTTTTVAEYTSPAPTGQAPKAMLVKPAAGNTTAGGGASDTACTVPAGVTSAGTFANINQALGATNAGDTIYVCPKYTAGAVVPYVEQVSLGFTNLSVVGITDGKGSRAVIAANPNTPTTSTTQMGMNYIVQIVATGVNFGNFVIDGAPTGTNFAGTGIFNGIVVRRSGAFVFNNTVQNIRTADAATNANGQGITVFGAGSSLEAGTTASPVNILNNVVQNFRSNGVNVSAGGSSAYAFVRGNYIIGNGAAAASINQSGVQFLTGANGDIFNNRITNVLNNNASACTAAAFNNCSAGIRLNTTAGTSANNLRVRFNTMNKTQTGIFGLDVQYLNIASNTITGSEIDGIHLQGSTFNLGSNFNLITANQIFSSRRSGIFIGQPGGDASLGNNINTNVIEDSYFGVEDFTPAGNNTITNTGAAANTFINVNRTVGNDGAANGGTTNPLP